MNKYNNGKIYKLVSDQTNEIYIGSTTVSLNIRIRRHNDHYSYYLNNNKLKRDYISSFEIIKYGDCRIVLIENYSCNSREELLLRERYYYETVKCVNIRIPKLTEEELSGYWGKYRDANKEKITEREKKYYENNKEKISESRSQTIRCEKCNKDISKRNQARHNKTKKHNI